MRLNMGYAHITNLYRPEGQTILLFRECYALEKIHGTSSSVSWRAGAVHLHTGHRSQENFRRAIVACGGDDSLAPLTERFVALGHDRVIVHGEAYGGSEQKQSYRYGPELKFAAFDVQIGDVWLAVPNAADVCAKLGLEFVYYERVSTDLSALDAQRDAPSEQARRNGLGDKPREGVVLRPLVEVTMSNGERICAKHKRTEERETATERPVVDPSKLQVLANAEAIALEWVTPTRLQHVLAKLPDATQISATKQVIDAMVEDVVREGAGEFVDSKEARSAIGKRTVELFRAHLKSGVG